VMTGFVLDNVTGLSWQEPIDSGMPNCSGGCSPAYAITYCANLTVGGQGGWRLPTYVELVSLLDYSQANPPLINPAFSSTPDDSFWSSTPSARSPGNAWYVYFNAGASYNSLFARIRAGRITRREAAEAATRGRGIGSPRPCFGWG
jgi:Protein of unknown function (DUF1566)